MVEELLAVDELVEDELSDEELLVEPEEDASDDAEDDSFAPAGVEELAPSDEPLVVRESLR